MNDLTTTTSSTNVTPTFRGAADGSAEPATQAIAQSNEQTLSENFRGNSRGPARRSFDQLTGEQQGIMQLFMLLMLLFKDNHSLDETFAGILETDVESLNEFRDSAVRRGLTGDQAAREYRYSENTDFARAASFNGSLLDVIKKHESNGGDYNILNGGGHRNLTDMSIREVLAEQANWRSWPKGASSAVGAYQIINKTLKAAVNEMGLDLNAKFDANMQDRIALHLLEKRGLTKFLNGSITEAKFMSNLAHEWASLPEKFNGEAAYGGTANNPATVPLERVNQIVGAMRNARDSFEDGATQLAAISGVSSEASTPSTQQSLAASLFETSVKPIA